MQKKQLVIIMKNPGTCCNLRCVYCAEGRKKYESIDSMINLEQAQRLSYLSEDYSLNVLFHGGEPTLLPVEYYEKLMDTFQACNNDVYFGIQTNAYEIDDYWVSFLKSNKRRLGVSVSLDGTQSMNRYRINSIKGESYSQVISNVKKMSENKIDTGMICTLVSSSLGKERELVDLLLSLDNLLFVKLNPCFDKDETGIPAWAITPKQYAQFVQNVFSIMLEKGKWNSFYIEPILSLLKNLHGAQTSFCNYSFNKCEGFISLYPDGTITSCDNFNLHQGFLGQLNEINSLEEVLGLRSNTKLSADYQHLMEACRTCDYAALCKGGCIAIRDRYKGSDEYCISMKSMIDYIKGFYEALVNESP